MSEGRSERSSKDLSLVRRAPPKESPSRSSGEDCRSLFASGGVAHTMLSLSAGGDKRLRQSITIKSKVGATVVSGCTIRVADRRTVDSSYSAKTVVTSVSHKGTSSTRSMVEHRNNTDATGRPEVVRATMFAQKTSGGASETVATYENSRTGVRQLSVGRHIGDRSHLSEKSRNEFTGEEEKREALVNIAYEELGGFDQEWKERMAP